MKCEELRPELSAYLDGELSELERLKVEHHLQRCAACASEYEAMRLTVEFLRQFREPEVEVPAGFREGLRARLAQLPPPAAVSSGAPDSGLCVSLPAQRTGRGRRWWRLGLPAAAAAAAAAAVALAYSPASPLARPPLPPVASADRTPPSAPRAVAPGPGAGDPGSGGGTGHPLPAGSAAGQVPPAEREDRGGKSASGGARPHGESSRTGQQAGAAPGEPGNDRPGGGTPDPGPDFRAGGYVDGLGTATAARGEKPARVGRGELLAQTFTEHIAVRDVEKALAEIEAIVRRLGGTALNPPRVVGLQPVEVVFQVPAGREQEASARIRALGRVVENLLPVVVDYSDDYNRARANVEVLKENLAKLEENVRQGVLSEKDAQAQRAALEQDLRDEEANVNYYWEKPGKVDFRVLIEKDEAAGPEKPPGPGA